MRAYEQIAANCVTREELPKSSPWSAPEDSSWLSTSGIFFILLQLMQIPVVTWKEQKLEEKTQWASFWTHILVFQNQRASQACDLEEICSHFVSQASWITYDYCVQVLPCSSVPLALHCSVFTVLPFISTYVSLSLFSSGFLYVFHL